MYARAIAYVWPALIAFVIALTITLVLTSRRLSQLALDRPNARSLHVSPVPRTGGLALFAAAAAASWMFSSPAPALVVIAFAAVAAVSLLDDVREVPAAVRLTVHVGAAVWIVFSPVAAGHSLPAQIAAVLAIAWAANLYNFMDGVDGLAAGMAAIGFLALGLAAAAGGSESFARMNFIVAGAAAGFLLLNFAPARIFLGDVGSVPLGFLAAVCGLYGWSAALWPLWFPVAVFSPFVVDSTVTLLRRALRREQVWQAHRDHYYQRLVQMGWTHRRTALTQYALMAIMALVAMAGLKLPPAGQTAILIALVIAYAAAMVTIELVWRNHVSRSRP